MKNKKTPPVQLPPWTEAEFWEHAAEAWDGPKLDDIGTLTRFCGATTAGGICLMVWIAFDRRRITLETCQSVHDRMRKHRPKDAGRMYWWRFNLAGAKKLAAFCRRMAKLARKEEAKHVRHRNRQSQ